MIRSPMTEQLKIYARTVAMNSRIFPADIVLEAGIMVLVNAVEEMELYVEIVSIPQLNLRHQRIQMAVHQPELLKAKCATDVMEAVCTVIVLAATEQERWGIRSTMMEARQEVHITLEESARPVWRGRGAVTFVRVTGILMKVIENAWIFP